MINTKFDKRGCGFTNMENMISKNYDPSCNNSCIFSRQGSRENEKKKKDPKKKISNHVLSVISYM